MTECTEALNYASTAIALAAAVMLLIPLVLIDCVLLYAAALVLRALVKKRRRKPGRVYLRVLREGANGMLTFILKLPEKSAADVVSRELSVSVAGADAEVLSVAADATSSQEFTAEQGATVSGSLVDIDDAGNRSPAREFSFVLADTIAPPQPGEVGVEVVSEQ